MIREQSDNLSDKSRGRYRVRAPLASDKLSAMPKKRNPLNVAVGHRLMILRLVKKFGTIRAFAKEIDVHEDTYRAWETGDNKLPVERAIDLQQRFGPIFEWLYRNDIGRLSVEFHSQVLEVEKRLKDEDSKESLTINPINYQNEP